MHVSEVLGFTKMAGGGGVARNPSDIDAFAMDIRVEHIWQHLVNKHAVNQRRRMPGTHAVNTR